MGLYVGINVISVYSSFLCGKFLKIPFFDNWAITSFFICSFVLPFVGIRVTSFFIRIKNYISYSVVFRSRNTLSSLSFTALIASSSARNSENFKSYCNLKYSSRLRILRTWIEICKSW